MGVRGNGGLKGEELAGWKRRREGKHCIALGLKLGGRLSRLAL